MYFTTVPLWPNWKMCLLLFNIGDMKYVLDLFLRTLHCAMGLKGLLVD